MDLDDISLRAQELKELHKLSYEEAQYLKGLHIQLINPVLPQHQIESRAGSRPPLHSEIERFEQIIPIKRGSYNSLENKIISKNWKTFCKLHNWNRKKVEPFLLLREENRTHIRSKKERRKFVQFLAHGLPNRTLYSIYYRFRTLYSHRLKRRFQPHEDEMILDHLEHNPNLDNKRKYSDLAKVLERTRMAIWRRYKLLKQRREKKNKFVQTNTQKPRFV